jgi:HK97 family phage prohead protease
MHQTVISGRAAPCASREIKRAATSISDISAQGIFEGYASLFGQMDLGGDTVERSAFRDTLERRGAPLVKMLWQHDGTEPIGSWLSIVEDARGLKVRGKLNLAVARAREALALMREGAVDGLSIGFRTERSIKDVLTGGRRLQKIDLQEISLVTFPMLPRARVTAVKRREIDPVTRDGVIRPGSLAARRTDLHIKYLRQRSTAAALRFELELKRAACRAPETRYSADQQREPAGTPEGGRWAGGGGGATSEGGAEVVADLSMTVIRLAQTDVVMSDASPDAVNNIGDQYAHLAILKIPQAGNARIDKTTDALLTTLSDIKDAIPAGSGPLYGTTIHYVFAQAVKAQNFPGIDKNDVEQSFSLRGIVDYGLQDSVRTDISLWDESRKEVIAIYDLKTGGAQLTDRRIAELLAAVPGGDRATVIELRLEPRTRRR